MLFRKVKADKVIYGNIITLDDRNTIAEAIAIKDGKIVFVGSKLKSRLYISRKTKIIKYKKGFVYPGFIDSHAHGTMAANEFIGTIDLTTCTTVTACLNLVKSFIKKHPEKLNYVGSNLVLKKLKTKPTAADLDKVCADTPVYLQTEDNHTCWVNSKVLKIRNINAQTAKKYGPNLVEVDKDGNPTGILHDNVVMDLFSKIKFLKSDLKEGLLQWQKLCFSQGYTAVCDAAVITSSAVPILSSYHELSKENKFKLRTYAYYMINENSKHLGEELENAVDLSLKLNTDYFKIHGVKLFMDGVVEAHTAWLVKQYNDQKGYKGLARISDSKLLTNFIVNATRKNMPCHFHSVGDKATKVAVNAILDAQKKIGNKDMRHIIAHLQLVDPNDIRKIGKNHIIACVPPLWTPKAPFYYQQEKQFIGKNRADKSYPIRSFIKAKAKVVFHSDYPVSPVMSIPKTIYKAITRMDPDRGKRSCRWPSETINRKQALCAFTKNAAYAFNEEKNFGTIEVGKIANLTVFNTNFLNCRVNKILDAKLLNTFVDGKIVF